MNRRTIESRTGKGALPPRVQLPSLLSGHAWRKKSVWSGQLRDLIERLPLARGKTGQICRTQRRRTRRCISSQRLSENVGLELHQHPVATGSPVGEQDIEVRSCLGLHHVKDIAHLIGDGFDGSAGQVRGCRTARESAD